MTCRWVRAVFFGVSLLAVWLATGSAHAQPLACKPAPLFTVALDEDDTEEEVTAAELAMAVALRAAPYCDRVGASRLAKPPVVSWLADAVVQADPAPSRSVEATADETIQPDRREPAPRSGSSSGDAAVLPCTVDVFPGALSGGLESGGGAEKHWRERSRIERPPR